MKKYILLISMVSACLTQTAFGYGNGNTNALMECGAKPPAPVGCHIGRCIDGAWQKICTENTAQQCGVQPTPAAGCSIGRCVNGNWEQKCSSCGPQPPPHEGCVIGSCVSGVWQQICK